MGMAPAVMWSLDTIKASDCDSNLGPPCDHYWQCRTRTSGQTQDPPPSHYRTMDPNMVLSSIWVWTSPLPPAAAWSQDANLALLIFGVWAPFDGNKSFGHL